MGPDRPERRKGWLHGEMMYIPDTKLFHRDINLAATGMVLAIGMMVGSTM